MRQLGGGFFLLSVVCRLSCPTSPSLLRKEVKEGRKGKEGEEREERYSLFATPKEFTPFLVALGRARPAHPRVAMGPPSLETIPRAVLQLGGVDPEAQATTARAASPDPSGAVASPIRRGD
jgi:hypothetical protein